MQIQRTGDTKRIQLIEQSYADDSRLTVNAAGLFYTGIVVDINDDENTFVLMYRQFNEPEGFDTFYLDEVMLDVEPYLI